ncbi:MAG TPA: class I SAM-dependent methyltransferase [Halomicronema sp.]
MNKLKTEPSEILTNTQTNLGPVLQGDKFRQKFYSKSNYLSSIYLWVATYCKQIKTVIKLEIIDCETQQILRETTLKTDNFIDNKWQIFEFEPILNSQNKTFEFCFQTFSTHQEQAITLWTNNQISGICQKNAQPLNESICFRCEYSNNLNLEVEKEIAKTLKDYFEGKNFWGDSNELVNNLMSVSNYLTPFESLLSVIPTSLFTESSKILISGMAVGSEMIAAKNYGFGEVYGVEVEPLYVEICEKRFTQLEKMYPSLYDGLNLPYADNTFDVIISSHIIEHTESPFKYLKENLRVLKTGGYLFLEYPTRYHNKELHTNLPSLEWLPILLRYLLIKSLTSKLSPLAENVKNRYQIILKTQLKPISFWQIQAWLRQSNYHPRLIYQSKPYPGIVRCIFQK